MQPERSWGSFFWPTWSFRGKFKQTSIFQALIPSPKYVYFELLGNNGTKSALKGDLIEILMAQL